MGALGDLFQVVLQITTNARAGSRNTVHWVGKASSLSEAKKQAKLKWPGYKVTGGWKSFK